MTMILMGRPWLAMVASSGMRHLEAAVAADGEDQLVGMRELRADGGGQAEAHRAEAAGGEPQARLVEADELRGPHLVLADVGGDDGLAAGDAVDLAHEVLRLDLGRRRRRPRSGCSSFHSRICCHQACGARRASASRIGLESPRATLLSLPSTRLTSPTMGTSGGAVLADLGGVDIHVDDLGVRREGGQAAGDAVVEAHAERDQQVALGHAHVGGVAAVHAGHADEIGMVGGERAEAHQRAARRARRRVSTNSRSSGEASAAMMPPPA